MREQASKAVRRLLALVIPLVVLAVVAVGALWRSDLLGGPAGATAIDPSIFAPGACESLPPTSGDLHTVVFLDAGHGGIDPGAVGTTESGTTVTEASETLPIELATASLLRAKGFTVVVSRTRPTTVVKLSPGDVSQGALTLQGVHDDTAARDLCADMAHAQLLVGIYLDAGSSVSDAGSVTGYDADRSFSDDNLRLARLVQGDVLAALNAHGWQIPDEGVLTDSGLGSYQPGGSGLAAKAASYDHLMLLGPPEKGYFSTPSEMPGVVVEPLYITDPFEATIAASNLGHRVIASGLAKAIEQYFKVPNPSGRSHADSG